jgi:hypothetical protein
MTVSSGDTLCHGICPNNYLVVLNAPADCWHNGLAAMPGFESSRSNPAGVKYVFW